MPERWDRDRFMYERSRDQQSRRGDDDDDAYTMRGGLGRGRDLSEDGRRDPRFNRSFDDDDMVRDRRYYDDEPRLMPRREREQPPPETTTRRVVLEKERERDFFPRRASPSRRPGFLRRQSSLDTFDRPSPIFHRREEYPPPARREDIRRDDFRAPPYAPIPLPKTRGLPPPQRFPDQGFYDEIKTAEPGDDDYPPYPDRVREREVIKTSRRRRDRSRDSFSTRTRSHRSSSTSSASSHSSGSSGGTTVRSEYPKKGKTRIPAKLVSKRALIDIGYPFVQEGNTIIVQKALGQDNIDELLKVSEEYKKIEQDSQKPPPAALMPPPESKASDSPESRVPPAPPSQAPPPPAFETRPPPPPMTRAPETMAPPPPPPLARTSGPAPVVINAHPPFIPEPPAEYWEEISTRDTSPSRSSTTTSTTWDTHHHHHHGHRREKSAPVDIGPLALVERSRSRSRHGRSKSRSGRELRAEIRALERELVHRPRGVSERELVRAERMPNGELVVYEEEVEKVVEHHKPPRIEKDKKGPPPGLMRAMLATLT